VYAASSTVARGKTPGSVRLVRNKVDITNINRIPSTTGIAGVRVPAKYGQLHTKHILDY